MTTAALGQSGFSDSMSGQQIYDNFMNAKGPGDLQQAQDHLTKVMSTYQDRAQRITSLAASMEEGWTGEAAEAAQRSAGPLALAHEDAAMQMVQASKSMEAQSQAFYDTKNRVVPVPEIPKAPSFVDNVITLGSANTTYETKVIRSLVAAQQNVNAMKAWTGTSTDNGSRMPSSYGTLDPGALDVTMASSSSAPSVGSDGGTTIPGGGSAGYAPVGGAYHSPTPTASTTPSGLSGGTSPDTTPVDYQPRPIPNQFDPVVRPPGGTGPGVQSPSGPDGWAPVGTISGVLSSDGSTAGYRSGSGSLSGTGSGGGRLSGGTGSPVAKELGSGNRVGAGTSGTSGTAGAHSGRAGSAGAAGRPGTSGMGAGVPSGKGNGEEDAEHDRKYILDDDEPFQLAAEGERLIDSNTGLSVAPPVIG